MAYRDIKAQAITQPAGAVKLRLKENGDIEVWIPRSLIEDEGAEVDDRLMQMGYPVFDVSVAEWKCDKEGWL